MNAADSHGLMRKFFLQLTQHSKSSTGRRASKVTFVPLCELKTEGISLEILVKGLIFLDVQFGMTAAAIDSCGNCACGVSISNQEV